MLKLAFAGHLEYARKEGFRTAELSLPFKMLSGLKSDENKMVRLEGEVSNELFEILTEWSAVLEHRKSPDLPVPPCSP